MQSKFIFLFVFLVHQSVYCQLRWRKIVPANGSATIAGRMNHAMVYDEQRNRILVFGGKIKVDMQDSIVDDTWEFNMTSRMWREIPGTVHPQNRFSFVYGLANNHFYVSTGEGLDQSGKRAFYNDIWKFNLDTDTWQAIENKGSPPNEIYGATGGVFNANSKHFFVTHGFAAQRYTSGHVFNVDTETWTEVYADKSSYIYGHPNGRCLHGGAMVSEQDHVLFGGCASGGKAGGACPGLDSWFFDGTEQSWTQLGYCASPRNFPSLALLPMVGNKKRVVMYGGVEKNDQVLKVEIADPDQVAIFDVNAKEWYLKRTAGVYPPKRAGAVMVQHPQGILMFGGSFMNDIWLLEGDSDAADSAPMHAQTCKKPFAGTLNLIMLHGVFMVIGWGILLQLGAFIARYFRKQDPMWFHIHRILQTLGLLFAIGGLVCGVESVRFDDFKFAHGGLGLFIMIIGLLQPLNAIIRPHKEKGEEASLKRKVWEMFHINSGRVALILAVIEISLGLLQSQAFSGHHIAWHVYVAVFVIAYVIMEIRMRVKGSSSASRSIEMR